MKKAIKILFYTTVTFWIAIIIFINIKLYYTPNFYFVNIDEQQHLRYLHQAIFKKRKDKEMQQIFPEGYLFTNVLYGLSVAEVGMNCKSQSQKDSIIKLLYTCIERCTNEEAQSIFNASMQPKYGIFYNGWTNYLLQKQIMLLPFDTNLILLKKYVQHSRNLMELYNNSALPYLPSYAGATWPADNIVCIASLGLMQRIDSTNYNLFIKNWKAKAIAKNDKKYQCIPHEVNYLTNETITGARGSSQALINCFLPEIDTQWAATEFKNFKSNFFTKQFGLVGVREFPKGEDGEAHIDSGPVIFGIGASASITAAKACFANQDMLNFYALRNNIEAFGFPLHSQQQKFYLAKQMAVADAFIAWVNGSDNNIKQFYFPNIILFHFYSLLFISLPFLLKWIIKKLLK